MDIIKANGGPSLSQVKKAALEKLPTEYRILILAALQPKISELPALEVVTDIATILTTAYTIAGQQPDTKSLALYADEFYTKLLATFPSVTKDEIREAIRAGVYGEYGDYFGLNPKSFIHFVTSYLHSVDRFQAKEKFDYSMSEFSSSQKVSTDVEQNNVDFVNLLYSDLLKGVLNADFIPTFLYDFLVERKIIDLSLDEKKVINDIAHARYLDEFLKARQPGDIAKPIARFFREFEIKSIIKIKSKQIAVYRYLEACKLSGKTLPLSLLYRSTQNYPKAETNI